MVLLLNIYTQEDKGLHKEYVFATYLEKMLSWVKEASIELEDKLKLEFYKLEQIFKADIVLDSSEEYKLENPKTINTDGKPADEDEFLEEIIKRVNERYKGKFTEGDRLIAETVYKRMYKG